MLSRFFLRHVKIHGSLFRPCQMSFQRSPIRTTGLFSCRRQHQNAFPPPRFAEYLPPPKPQWKDKSKAVRYSINGATGVGTIMAVTLGAIFWHCREQDPATRRKILKLFSNGFVQSWANSTRQLGTGDMSLILSSTSILPDDDPSTVMVNGIMEKILRSNGLQNINYLKIHVVDMISQYLVSPNHLT
jgi:hypothetical protein